MVSENFYKKYDVRSFQDNDFLERIQFIESASREYHQIPETRFSLNYPHLEYRQLKINAIKPKFSRTSLHRFSVFLDHLTAEGFVHGDLNRKNILFDGRDYYLIDLEPSIQVTIRGKSCYMVTPPYISIIDLEENRITQRTDKIGFYYYLKRIKNELKTEEIPILCKRRCINREDTLPEKEAIFCNQSFEEIFTRFG